MAAALQNAPGLSVMDYHSSGNIFEGNYFSSQSKSGTKGSGFHGGGSLQLVSLNFGGSATLDFNMEKDVYRDNFVHMESSISQSNLFTGGGAMFLDGFSESLVVQGTLRNLTFQGFSMSLRQKSPVTS